MVMELNYSSIWYYCRETHQSNRSTSNYCCTNYDPLYNAQ